MDLVAFPHAIKKADPLRWTKTREALSEAVAALTRLEAALREDAP